MVRPPRPARPGDGRPPRNRCARREHGGLPRLPSGIRRHEGACARRRRLPARCSRFTTRIPEALAHEEIASILFSLTFAGHETTNYLIGNLVRRLLEDPHALVCGRRRPGADPRRRSRDAPLRPVGPGLAAGDDAARHPRRRQPASRARNSFSGSPHPAATLPSSRSRRLRSPARERPRSARLWQGDSLLPRRRARQTRGENRARGADAPFPRLRLVRARNSPSIRTSRSAARSRFG